MLIRLIFALTLSALLVFPAAADDARLDSLFTALASAEEDEWEAIEEEIWVIWSASGSAAMDLLLERGRQAIAAGEHAVAIEHLTALTDHAPDFAEGWNARATAYFLADLYGPSLADIRRTLALEPRHFGAIAGLGLILEEIGNQPGALEAFRRGAALHPRRADFIEAIERLDRAVLGKDT